MAQLNSQDGDNYLELELVEAHHSLNCEAYFRSILAQFGLQSERSSCSEYNDDSYYFFRVPTAMQIFEW